jgi:hypothetical protein
VPPTADLDVRVLDHQLIGIGAEVADRFRDGNVFLVGDAAHRTAPTGAAGMNTAIHSACNLAWKLAAVLAGVASPALLDSYEPERRPSGERNLLRSRGQLQGVSGVAADLGVVYSSSAVVAEDGRDRPALIEPTQPACVGSRAPHVWLDADGVRVSTLDFFGERMVLVTGMPGHAWRRAAQAVSRTLDTTLGALTIGGAELTDVSAQWRSAFGIDADGAVLVRPDGTSRGGLPGRRRTRSRRSSMPSHALSDSIRRRGVLPWRRWTLRAGGAHETGYPSGR